MTLSSAIHAARSGLETTSLRAEIVADNVANASTPGYVRRSLVLSETIAGAETTGVAAVGVARSADESLAADRRALTSEFSQATLSSSTWTTISVALGDGSTDAGLFGAITRFEETLADLAVTPESSELATLSISAAKGVTSELNSLSDLAQSLRAEADQEIADGVAVVNQSLDKIKELNAEIAGTNRSSARAAALFDERDRVLGVIAEYVPIQTVARDSGAIDIVTPEGVFLFAGQPRHLEFQSSGAIGPSQSLENGSLGRLTAGGIDLTPGAPSYGAVSGGLMGALFSLRDNDLPRFSGQLDTLAADLVERFSQDGLDPTTAADDPGLFWDPQGPDTTGLAGRVALNPLVDPDENGDIRRVRDGLGSTTPGPPGDNTVIKGLLDAMTEIRPINSDGVQGFFSSAELAAHLSSLTAQFRLSHETSLSSIQTQLTAVTDAIQQSTGVDLDQQMQTLLLVEQAYSANARVIEIADQMLNRLLEI